MKPRYPSRHDPPSRPVGQLTPYFPRARPYFPQEADEDPYLPQEADENLPDLGTELNPSEIITRVR
jgi:hypothetical protein